MVFPRKFFVLCCCNRNIAIGRHYLFVTSENASSCHHALDYSMSMSACRPVAGGRKYLAWRIFLAWPAHGLTFPCDRPIARSSQKS